ncbi:MAG TPA: TRAM domain-containing protein [Candidatus Saccharimonadales bacterium]|nr:TRAM domain-containing protein [Candidatus Saccharimonadales bacterium]
MAKEKKKHNREDEHPGLASLPPRLVGLLAEEVAKTVVKRLPHVIPHPTRRKNRGGGKNKNLEHAFFLDTSAIIDRRVFEVANIGTFMGTFVILESILLELKHIADSQDAVKRERGRRGLALLEKLKKSKLIKVVVFSQSQETALGNDKLKEVDEKLMHSAKSLKGRIITCDYNLEKKASISGVTVINMNTLANHLKITAVPGEALHIKLLHAGKDPTQGVGYLDDGTMIVVENASEQVDKYVDVIVARVIQTTAGRILFGKKI